MASGADRTREKEIFGIFGFINTIKITNGKFSEVASVVLTIEIERLFLHTHAPAHTLTHTISLGSSFF